MIVNDLSRGLILASLFFCGCSGTESTGGAGGGSQSVGGAVTTGGSLGAGGTNYLGATGLGGSTSLGGSNATAGGASNSAGTNSSGGAANTGGSNAAAGNTAAGGATSPGGSKATGGNVGIGGSAATAGSKASGGITGTGGASSGGTMGTGGTNATGGNTAVTCGNNPAPASCSVTGTLQAVPQLPRNSCKSNSLPQAWGTNFATPEDPAGWGDNTTAMGWEGNWWPTNAYLSGAFFARGVPATYTIAYGKTAYIGTAVCGTMYSFGVATAGAAPAAGSVNWSMDSGYLPAFTTSLTRNSIDIGIKNFENKVTINGHDFGLVYSRVTLKNNSTASATVDPQPSAGLTALTSNSTTLAAGQSVSHDFVVVVDDFGSGQALPTGAALMSAAPDYDTAYSQMVAYWNNRLQAIPTFQLPNIALPSTNLNNPGDEISHAFKANFIYTRIVQVGKAPFSGANNYAWLLNHDLPEILANRFVIGDFQDAQNLLLTGRTSEDPNFPSYGANWYWDGLWKSPWAWAIYLAKTGDTTFVSQYFHDDANATSTWGPSIYTQMHRIPGMSSNGYLDSSNDNDSQGTWLFDDYSAIMGLAGYKYLATQIGNTTEATWANSQMTTLINGTNTALNTNEKNNNFNHLPCEVTVPPVAGNPPTGDRCGNASDANWASAAYDGQNAWDSFLIGASLTGTIGDPAQTDALYDWGYARLNGVLPFPTMGGYSSDPTKSYSTANNTGYAQGGLFGTKYRDLPLTSYAWQIATSTGGPYSWWEANNGIPVTTDPWAGNHPPVEFGACPYAWPLAGQSLALIDSIAAEGLSATATGSSFTFTRPLYIGRGIPNVWIASGQTIAVNGLTSQFNMATCARSTYGVTISVSGSPRVVTVALCGTLPGGPIYVQLPIFNTVSVTNMQGGTYDATAKSVTVNTGTTTIVITLNS